MGFDSQRSGATDRLVSLGVSRSSAAQLLTLVDTWVGHSGPEWAVERLKGLKTAYVHHLNGGDWKPDWVSWKVDRPKGPFGFLWHQPLKKGNAERALNTLVMYSSLTAPRVTRRQAQKFVGSVINPPPVEEDLDDEVISSVYLPVTRRKAYSVSIDRFPRSPEKKMPVFGRSVFQNDDARLPDVLREARALGLIDLYPGVFAKMRDLVLTQPWLTRAGESPAWGKVSFIQEPGYKLRAIANPNLVLQAGLRPLQAVIWDLLREIPEDCTFDQERGVVAVKGWLEEGATVHSVDLSDATNVFPLGVQMRLLQRALVDRSWSEHLSLFHRASTGRWAFRDPFSGRAGVIQWVKGQPLGLAPSFGAFAFAHHFVARLAQSRAGSGDYRILGDDIVIRGDRMVREYRALLRQLGCPVSESKTLSGRVAEFAGKIVTRDNVISTAKWRDVSDANFVDIARSLGPRSMPFFRPRQRAVLREIAELPEFLGGLGWNPMGKPMGDRLRLLPYLDRDTDTEFIATRLSWTSEYMWSRQGKPSVTYTPPRTEKARAVEVPSHRQVVGRLRPLTESLRESETIHGYGPSAASQQHATLNLVRWERLLSEANSSEEPE